MTRSPLARPRWWGGARRVRVGVDAPLGSWLDDAAGSRGLPHRQRFDDGAVGAAICGGALPSPTSMPLRAKRCPGDTPGEPPGRRATSTECARFDDTPAECRGWGHHVRSTACVRCITRRPGPARARGARARSLCPHRAQAVRRAASSPAPRGAGTGTARGARAGGSGVRPRSRQGAAAAPSSPRRPAPGRCRRGAATARRCAAAGACRGGGRDRAAPRGWPSSSAAPRRGSGPRRGSRPASGASIAMGAHAGAGASGAPGRRTSTSLQSGASTPSPATSRTRRMRPSPRRDPTLGRGWTRMRVPSAPWPMSSRMMRASSPARCAARPMAWRTIAATSIARVPSTENAVSSGARSRKRSRRQLRALELRAVADASPRGLGHGRDDAPGDARALGPVAALERIERPGPGDIESLPGEPVRDVAHPPHRRRALDACCADHREVDAESHRGDAPRHRRQGVDVGGGLGCCLPVVDHCSVEPPPAPRAQRHRALAKRARPTPLPLGKQREHPVAVVVRHRRRHRAFALGRRRGDDRRGQRLEVAQRRLAPRIATAMERRTGDERLVEPQRRGRPLPA